MVHSQDIKFTLSRMDENATWFSVNYQGIIPGFPLASVAGVVSKEAVMESVDTLLDLVCFDSSASRHDVARELWRLNVERSLMESGMLSNEKNLDWHRYLSIVCYLRMTKRMPFAVSIETD